MECFIFLNEMSLLHTLCKQAQSKKFVLLSFFLPNLFEMIALRMKGVISLDKRPTFQKIAPV